MHPYAPNLLQNLIEIFSYQVGFEIEWTIAYLQVQSHNYNINPLCLSKNIH